MAQNNYVDEMTINGVSHEIQDTEARERIALLEEAYQGLTQSDIIIVDGDLPVSGQEKNKIYRKTGTNSYTDYMWDGTQFVPMATYNNAVDTTFDPTSDNLASEKATATYLAEKLAKKANINGTYLAMCVGMSKNVEAQSELSGTSLFRPTAGENEVADGPASVKVIKGNAKAWNQLAPLPSEWQFYNGSYVTLQADNENRTLTITNKTNEGIRGDNSMVMLKNSLSINRHKCYISFYHSASYAPNKIVLDVNNTYYGEVSNDVDTWELSEMIVPLTNVPDFNFFIKQEGSGGIYGTIPAQGSYKLRDIMCFDLTLMFGTGNEPSSVAEFKTWLQNNIGKQNYYPTNPGKLLAAKLLGLRTVGFNQWDEQWEVGDLYPTSGSPIPSSSRIRSKNFCPIIPNTAIYGKNGGSGYLRIFYYRADKTFIAYNYITNTTKITPQDCYFFKIATENYGTTYNHDLCINLHYTNGRDGEYEPYVEHNYNFDTSKVYGKLNGEGELVQVFPDGMKSAGSIRDELTINGGAAKVIKRVGSVDLGSLTYSWRGDGTISSQDIVDYKLALNVPALCSRLQYRGTVQGIAQMSTGDKQIALFYNGDGTTRFLYIRDTSLSSSDVSQQGVVSKLSGVLLFYELAEPLEYTDLVYRDNGVDTPIDALNILVSNYGTEEQIVESPTNGDPNSCAATLDTLYGLNASDFMDAANNGAFISKASMDAFLSALGAAMGGTWSQTWNNSTGHYDYAFTATPQVESQE